MAGPSSDSCPRPLWQNVFFLLFFPSLCLQTKACVAALPLPGWFVCRVVHSSTHRNRVPCVPRLPVLHGEETRGCLLNPRCCDVWAQPATPSCPANPSFRSARAFKCRALLSRRHLPFFLCAYFRRLLFCVSFIAPLSFCPFASLCRDFIICLFRSFSCFIFLCVSNLFLLE